MRSMTTINNRSHSDMFLICAVYLWVSTSRDVQVRWFQHESAVVFFGGRVTYKCVGVSVVTPSGSAATAALMSDSRKSSTAVLITAGVAWFTRPTSSSACRIFLMRACGDT
jgi:hypothetical protein